MLSAPSLTRPFHGQPAAYAGRSTYGALDVPQLLDRARGQKVSAPSLFDRYMEGWAAADVIKILDATAPDYRFTDPLVGSFSGRSLYEYFDLLQEKLSRMGAISRHDLGFFLRGPMERRSRFSGLQFWREAPRIGLTGISEIEIRDRGVITERAAYDANLASDVLRRAGLPGRPAIR